MSPPVYVVGGWMRSGTSMMMQALHAGGMQAAYSDQRERLRTRHADEHYDPNVGGLWELDRADLGRRDLPHGFEGKLIKVLRRRPARFARTPGGVRLVYMLRDPEEQRQSLQAFLGRCPPGVERIAAETAANLAAIRAHPDIEVMTLRYEQVLGDPAGALGQVAGFMGVELDVAAAAAVVRPELRRYRVDELIPGMV